MTARTTAPRCVLLDANVVIESHNLGVWSRLKNDYRIMVPATVVRTEVLYHLSAGEKRGIRLQDEVANGEIIELEGTLIELQSVYDVFAPWFLEGLHIGEIEALALLQTHKVAGASFCTSDALAIRALAMMGLAHLGMSLEMMCRMVGLTKNFAAQFREDFLRRNIQRGQENMITRFGLATS